MDWAISAINTFNVCFHSYWKPEGALAQKLQMCITELTELMTHQEIPNMDKGIPITVTE